MDLQISKIWLKDWVKEIPETLQNNIEDFLWKLKENPIEDIKENIIGLLTGNNIKLEILIRLLKINLKELVVPGIIDKNWKLINKANQDYEAAIFLINKYFRKIDVKYLDYEKLDINKNKITLWWNTEDNISIVDESEENEDFKFKNMWIWLSNINDKKYSISHIVYEVLEMLELIPEKEKQQLKRFINFIDLSIVYKYELYLKNNWEKFNLYNYSDKILFGFAKFLNPEKVFSYFEDSNKNWFEILSNNDLVKLWFLNVSKRRANDLQQSKEDFKNRKNYEILTISWVEFILDLDFNIRNWAEIAANFWKWIIKVSKNGDVIINSPVAFRNGSYVWVYKKNEKDFYEKIDNLIKISNWNDAKYYLLKKLWYSPEIYKRFMPIDLIEKEQEERKKKEKKKIQKEAKKDEREFLFESQELFPENIKIWTIIYWKVYKVNWQTQVHVFMLENEDDYYFYTTVKNLKNWQNHNKLFEKWVSNPIKKFKIINISESDSNSYKYKVKLKQI